VTGFQESHTLNSDPAHGKFVTIFWHITNLGGTIESVGSHTVALQDSRGRVTPPAGPDYQLDARAQYGGHIYFTAIPPGTADDEVLTFDAPLDAANYRLLVTP